MIDLDDVRALAAGDPSGMLEAVAGLPRDLAAGYRAGLEAGGLPSVAGVTGVAFCGMGGSAIAGDVLRAVFREGLPVPLEVVRDAVLPAWSGPDTLVVCSSYSGETAETLACFEEARARGCRVVALTSGGTLAERAGSAGVAVVRIPPTAVAPRAALGHLAMGIVGALEAVGLVRPMAEDVREATAELAALAERLGPAQPRRANPAKELAWRLRDRVPVIWGAEGVGATAALRWKTQFNENAKVPAFASSLPELDHNEVVGWSPDAGRGFFIVALRHQGERPDQAARFRPSIELAEAAGAMAQEVWAVGRSALARLGSLVLTGDFVSVYLALLRGQDPTPVEAIDRLKRALAEA